MTRTNDVSKTAVVIGATSGIGREVAAQLASQGYRVGITGRREALLEELARSAPQRYETAAFDIAQPDACDRLAALTGSLGSPELIVFCSGTGDLNDGLDYRIEEATNRVNVDGFTRTVDWCYRYFECRGGGCLAAVTSVMGLRGSRTAPSYAASKAYQINYLESLRQKACRQKLPIRRYPSRIGAHGDDERRRPFLDRFAAAGRAVHLPGRSQRTFRAVRHPALAVDRLGAENNPPEPVSQDVSLAFCRIARYKTNGKRGYSGCFCVVLQGISSDASDDNRKSCICFLSKN